MENTHLSVVFLDVDVTEEQRICLIISLVTSLLKFSLEKKDFFSSMCTLICRLFSDHIL